jgi:hypothetical protein
MKAIAVFTAAVVASLSLALVRSPAACADADPASDVLIGASVFYPYGEPVAESLQRALNAETSAAARVGFPIKVALIDSPTDLGALPSLFGKPQQYASFLDQEFGFLSKPHPPLLVVMPNGYGVSGLPPAATAAARSLPKLSGTRTDDLARGAIVAVPKLAAAAGHRIAGESVGSGSGGGGGRALAIAGLALGAVGIAGAVIGVRRRMARRD